MDSPHTGMMLLGFPIHLYNMAQSKSFFGLRRGSTKTLTFCVYNGKQVTKDRVTAVKNTRSSMQMSQRAMMSTILKAYSAMKDICNHSFEGVPYGQKTMNTFISENINMIRKNVPNVNLSEWKGKAVENSYLISRGSLPSVSYSVEGLNVGFNANPTTIGQFFDLFGATQVGDMVTTCILDGEKFIWIRYTRTTENQSKVLGEGKVSTKFTPQTDIETNIGYGSELTDYSWENSTSDGLVILSIEGQSVGSIVSRKSEKGWLRSTCVMSFDKSSANYVTALATYPSIGEPILNGGNV